MLELSVDSYSVWQLPAFTCAYATSDCTQWRTTCRVPHDPRVDRWHHWEHAMAIKRVH